MRHSLFHLAVTLPLLLVSTAPRARGATAPELLYYRVQPKNDPHYFQVTLHTDGSGDTVLVAQKTENYSFALAPGELDQVKDLIRKAGFFQLPPKDPPTPLVRSPHTLRIVLDGQKRELKYSYRTELEPLGDLLRKLVQQGHLIQAMSTSQGVRAAIAALDARPIDRPIVQPEAFRKPLESHLDLVNDSNNLSRAFQALATITPAGEWSDVITKQLAAAHEPRRSHLLWAVAQVAHGGSPDAHRAMLAPLLTRILGGEYPSWTSAAKEKQDAFFWMVTDLGDLRYAPAIPTLVGIIRKLPQKEGFLAANALPKIGDPAVGPVAQLLDDPSARIRLLGAIAGRTLLLLSRSTAAFPAGHEKERDALRRSVDSQIAPRLRKLAQSDPSPEVRSRAAQALMPAGPAHH